MPTPRALTESVKSLAREVGFACVGVAPADEVPDAAVFHAWLARGFGASMGYLARNVAKRLCPAKLVPGARSVLCLGVSYADEAPTARDGLVARYARGRDYHRVLKRRCLALMDRIREIAPTFAGRAFVDSAPLLERSVARRAGLGRIGRNHCLIAPGLGSYLVLCEIVSDLPLLPDSPLPPGGCEDCGACVDACPTGALTDAGLDARRCLSYLTIEHAGAIPREHWPSFGRRLVGCDACQEACPHNRSVPPGDAELRARAAPLGGARLADVLDWSEADWDRATRGSATRRVRFERMVRNAVIASGHGGGDDDPRRLADALRRLRRRRGDLGDEIDWALARLAGYAP